ncbi:MAG: hypothetical protein U0521_15335 [Anaerolineae bacterium]
MPTAIDRISDSSSGSAIAVNTEATYEMAAAHEGYLVGIGAAAMVRAFTVAEEPNGGGAFRHSRDAVPGQALPRYLSRRSWKGDLPARSLICPAKSRLTSGFLSELRFKTGVCS